MNGSLTLCLEVIFWFALFVVFYTYLGYGIVLYILVKLKELFVKPVKYPLPASNDELPEVTLFITAFNEEDVVDEKMENSLDLDYPADKLHIVWVTDGSDDGTNERLQTRWAGKATVHFQPLRQGKTAAMTRGMTLVDTPLVVFTDANTMVNREAIREIVLAFRNPKVGCVAGEKRIAVQAKDGAAAGGEGIYWKYESTLKVTPKTITKLQRKFFRFNRNVTKVNRDAQLLQAVLEQNAKSDAAELKLLRFRLIFGTECDILRLRKRLRNSRETSRCSYPRKEAKRCRP